MSGERENELGLSALFSRFTRQLSAARALPGDFVCKCMSLTSALLCISQLFSSSSRTGTLTAYVPAALLGQCAKMLTICHADVTHLFPQLFVSTVMLYLPLEFVCKCALLSSAPLFISQQLFSSSSRTPCSFFFSART